MYTTYIPMYNIFINSINKFHTYKMHYVHIPNAFTQFKNILQKSFLIHYKLHVKSYEGLGKNYK